MSPASHGWLPQPWFRQVCTFLLLSPKNQRHKQFEPQSSVVAPSLKYAETLVHKEVVTSQSDCVSSEQHVCSREIPSAIPSSRSAGLNMYATSSAGTPNQIFSPMQPVVGASMPHVVTNGYSTCSTAPYMAPPVVLDRFDGNILKYPQFILQVWILVSSNLSVFLSFRECCELNYCTPADHLLWARSLYCSCCVVPARFISL